MDGYEQLPVAKNAISDQHLITRILHMLPARNISLTVAARVKLPPRKRRSKSEKENRKLKLRCLGHPLLYIEYIECVEKIVMHLFATSLNVYGGGKNTKM